MKKLLVMVSVSAMLSTFAFAEKVRSDGMMQHQEMQQERQKKSNQMQNQQKMTKEKEEKLDRAPEKVSQEMGAQEKGNAYGQGQGMEQGQGKKMKGSSGKGKKGN